MPRWSAETVWRDSLAGRLLYFLFTAWDESLVYRALIALGRYSSKLFAHSLFGAAWYAGGSGAYREQESLTARTIGRVGGFARATGARLGPALADIWASSLISQIVRYLSAWASTSLVVRVLTGYGSDVVLAEAESGVESVNPMAPLLGFLLGFLPLVPSDVTIAGLHLPSPTTLMIAGIWGVAALWVAHKFVTGDLRWRTSPVFLPFACFLILAATAAIQSSDRSASAVSLVLWVTAGLLFWLQVNLIRNSRDAVAFLGPILAGAALMTFWAIYQVFFPPVIEEGWVDVATSGNITRVFASLGNPNYLAEYMALYLPLGVAVWVQQCKRRLEMSLFVGLMALALILTYSRGGWLAGMIALSIFLLMRARRWLVLFFLGALAVPLVAPQSLIDRFFSVFTLADTSNLYRINVWTGVVDMLQKFWVLGAGLGADAFAKVYSEFMLPEARAAHAHNTYLQILAEMGFLGLLAALWTLLAVLRRTLVNGANPRHAVLLAAVPAAMIGLLFHGMVEHIWYNPKLLFAFWAVAGLGVGMATGEKEGAAV